MMSSAPALDAAPSSLLRREGAVSNAGITRATNQYGPAFIADLLGRIGQPDYFGWLDHVMPAAACSRPVRLYGKTTGYDGAIRHTETMPDRMIYKGCGNRRSRICPACAKVYQQDAYQVIRAGLVGGKGIPATVSQHPAIFATFTAPGFGPVHHRVVKKHTCVKRSRCDCRAEPCHARRDGPRCQHGKPQACFARHEEGDRRLGTPICLDCYDYDHHVVWNKFSGELWRRTRIALDRELEKIAKAKGFHRVEIRVDVVKPKPVTKSPVGASCGKAAEFQTRAVVHFHALVRLDGLDGEDPAAIVPPPAAITGADLEDAIRAATASVAFRTPPHPDAPNGWAMTWGCQDQKVPTPDVRHITLSGDGEVTDSMVAGYLAKYATKGTEITGHSSTRITDDNVSVYADLSGSFTQRLIAACWRLGLPPDLLANERAQLEASVSQADERLTAAALLIGTAWTLSILADLAERHPDLVAVATDRPGLGLRGIARARRATLAALVTNRDTAGWSLGNQTPEHWPAPGAAPAWTCSTCDTVSHNTYCQTCAARRREELEAADAVPTVEPPEPSPYAGLRRWAHMLGFGGHFLTKSRRYSVTFRYLRDARIIFRRTESGAPEVAQLEGTEAAEETVLVVNSLAFAGIGWHTTADAVLANTAAALAREYRQTVREEKAHQIGSET